MRNVKLFQLIVVLSLSNCSEKEEPCFRENFSINEAVGIYEAVGDTSLVTDTAYQYHVVYFRAINDIKNPLWQIGESQRLFTQNQFFLIFNDTGKYGIKFSGDIYDNCTLQHKPISYESDLVIISSNLSSPLVGKWIGTNTGESRQFIIEIKFWKGNRYPFWPQGAYMIHNLPENFNDTTREINGLRRPELNGLQMNSGYKNFMVDEEGWVNAQSIKGYGSLTITDRNEIKINYRVWDMETYSKTGQTIYVYKTFVGNRII